MQEFFEQGAFVVSISGNSWHSVRIDEMLINKSCKMSVVRPSRDYINRIVHYLPHRTTMLENIHKQLFSEKDTQYHLLLTSTKH